MFSEDFYRLAVQYIEGYGNATLKKMLRLSGSATNLFTQADLWRSALTRRHHKLPLPTVCDAVRRAVDEELFNMEKHHIDLCFYLDSDFPYRLKGCSDSPIFFYYKGKRLFNMPHVLAVVGTREATEYGRNVVRKILSELKQTDVVTVSGLAYGIDTEAHVRSLEFGLRTMAVMGCGLGTIYPHQNSNLADQILENDGTLLSEYNYMTPPDRMNFPKRNRIVAGLSDAVLVVQTANRGGSMITAYLAQSYNKDVFAVPGSVFDVSFDGCHALIRKNIAAVLTSGGDLMEMMNWDEEPNQVQAKLFVDLSAEEQCVVEQIREMGDLSIDRLSETMSEFSPSKLAGVLLKLELKGVICCKPGKVYALNQS